MVVAVGSGRLGVNLFRKSSSYAAVVAEGEGRQASRSFGKTSSYVSPGQPGPPPGSFQLSSRTQIFFAETLPSLVRVPGETHKLIRAIDYRSKLVSLSSNERNRHFDFQYTELEFIPLLDSFKKV